MLQSMTLLLFIAAAVIKDRQTCRIPNGLILAGAVNGCALRFLGEGRPGIADAAAGALLPLLLCGWLFILSMLGAGDIKLLMAVGVYLGWRSIGQVLLLAFLIGACLAIVRLKTFHLTSERGSYFFSYLYEMAAGHLKPYIDMEHPPHDRPWALHFSVPILLAVLYEQAPKWIEYSLYLYRM